MAKSIWRTKGDILAATVCAALSTTLGCARMILQAKRRDCGTRHSWNTLKGMKKMGVDLGVKQEELEPALGSTLEGAI